MANPGSSYTAALDWLLEEQDIGVRYLALRDLTGSNRQELTYYRSKSHTDGPLSTVLANVHPEGFWVQPGAGYFPKYTGTVWSIVLLAQLGAAIEADKKIATACAYLPDHSLTKSGQFTVNGLPSGTIDCLQGSLCAALLDFGYANAPLDFAFEWMARSVTGEGIAPTTEKDAPMRYYAGKCGTIFACGANNKLPCAWGAVKVMLAFSKLPKAKRTALIDRAIDFGVNFLFSVDPATAAYPCGYTGKPSGNWWKFYFPVFYVTDLMQNVEALVGLGYGADPRLTNALNIIREKHGDQGRWSLEYDYNSKTWLDFGRKKQPNKWVTLRALKVLRAVQ